MFVGARARRGQCVLERVLRDDGGISKGIDETRQR